MSAFARRFEWTGPSDDPNDETFGDVVEETTLDGADDYDAVLVGEPYDGAVIGREGAREGPGALREALAATKTHHYDAGPVGSVGDLGDVIIPEGGARETQATVADTAALAHETEALPVFLGGDNSLSYPNTAPLLDSGSLGVANLDAHLDVRAVRDDPTSGTPYRQLFDAGLEAYACVGTRHFETSTAYADYLREREGTIVTAEEVGEDSVAAADLALDALGDVETVYVSLDLDVLDAALAPGVSAPTPGGITTRELYRVLRLLATDDRIAGFEVVECAPPLDSGDRTARAGARAIAHFLSGFGVGRRD